MVEHDVVTASEPTGELPIVRLIGSADLKDALMKGLDDFWAMPTHVVFISLIYPVFAVVLGAVTLENNFAPDLFHL